MLVTVRKRKVLLLMIFTFIFLPACKRTLDDIIETETSFAGIIEEIDENFILIRVNKNEAAYKSSDLIVASLNTELTDDHTEFKIGDEVVVYYDGNIAESYPAQVNRVYAITLKDTNE